MKRRGMSLTGKNEIILTCPCANRLRSTRLKTSERFLDIQLIQNFLPLGPKLEGVITEEQTLGGVDFQ